MTSQTTRWSIFPNATAIRDAALESILHSAETAISARGAFHLVLAGGTTPRAVYQALRNTPAEWAKWQIWFGDERCLPPDHPERNSHMAREAWLDHVAIPAANIHVIPAESGATAGAAAYALELQGVGDFDLVLLGLGEDGHTASLFPGQDWGESGAEAALAVFDAPKPPPQRISLSAQRLSAARQVIFLVTGQSKRDAVGRWRSGAEIPAAAICAPGGVEVFVEEASLPPA